MKKKIITIQVSLLEAALIKKLREVEYGKFVVFKQKNRPWRVKTEDSNILNEKEGLELSTDITEVY